MRLHVNDQRSQSWDVRDRLNNSSEFVVLIGKNTKNLFRFVRWEMEIALKLELPIIAVNLNGKNGIDYNLCPPIIQDELVVHVPYGVQTINYALNHWPDEYLKLKREGVKGSRIYNQDIFNKAA